MRTATSLLNSAVSVLMPALLIRACGYSSSEAMSIYGVAMGMAVPLLFAPSALIGSIAVVVAPELSENYYRKREKAVRYDVEKTVKAAIFIATVLIPVLFVLGNALSVLLFDNEFCGELVRNCSFVVLPLCISLITNTILNSMNCEKRTLLHFCIGAVAMIICVLFLTRYIGVYAYGLGLALSQLICAALNLNLLRKKCDGIAYLKYTLHSVLIIVASCLFGWLLNGIVSHYLAPVWQLVICAPLLLGFTVGAQYCLEMVSSRPFKKLFARNKKKKAQ